MRTTIEFDNRDPEDKEALNRCLKSTDMACTLFEIQKNMRKRLTNIVAQKECEMGSINAIEMVFDEINDLIEANGININELIS